MNTHNKIRTISKKLFFLVLLFGLFQSCQEKSYQDEDLEAIIEEETIPYSVNNDANLLSQRITYINRTATIEPVISGLTDRTNNKNVNGAQEMFFWEHVAEVAPLQIDGNILSATHITLADNKAYVSYHRQGNIHKGAIEIIDLNNPNFPEIISQAFFQNSDINAVASDFEGNNSSRKIWLAMSDAIHGAQVIEIESQGGLISENYSRVNISNILGRIWSFCICKWNHSNQ